MIWLQRHLNVFDVQGIWPSYTGLKSPLFLYILCLLVSFTYYGPFTIGLLAVGLTIVITDGDGEKNLYFYKVSCMIGLQ